jgi:hypothetical protein
MKITKKMLKRIILEAMEEEERGSGVVAKLEAKLANIEDYEEDFMPVALKTARMMKPEAQKDLEALLDAGAVEYFANDRYVQPDAPVYMVAYAHDPVGEDYGEDILSASYQHDLEAFVKDTKNPTAKKILNLVFQHLGTKHEQEREDNEEYDRMQAQGLI